MENHWKPRVIGPREDRAVEYLSSGHTSADFLYCRNNCVGNELWVPDSVIIYIIPSCMQDDVFDEAMFFDVKDCPW